MDREQRGFPLEIRIKEGEEGRRPVLEGRGIPYGERSQLLFGEFVEVIMPGAFTESLNRGHEIKSYINHNPDYVLATTASNPPLKLRETEEGVFYEEEIPDTSYGEDLEKNVRAKRIKGSSFAFRVLEDNVRKEDGIVIREVTKAELYEVGPVTDPAYLTSTANTRELRSLYESCSERLRTQCAGDKIDDAQKRARVEHRRRKLESTRKLVGG